MESDLVRRISNWLRRGSGRMQYLTIISDQVLSRVDRPGMHESHWADPYRGCQPVVIGPVTIPSIGVEGGFF